MKLLCKQCGAILSLFDAMEDADGRRFLDLLKELPAPLIKPYIKYLRLFSPAQRALTWSRMLTLTQSLAPMMRAANVTRNGIDYAAPTDVWIAQLTALTDSTPPTLRLPLKDHGYLISIMAAHGERAAATAERATEHQRRTRSSGDRNTSPTQVGELLKPRSKPPEGWKELAFKGASSDDDHD